MEAAGRAYRDVVVSLDGIYAPDGVGHQNAGEIAGQNGELGSLGEVRHGEGHFLQGLLFYHGDGFQPFHGAVRQDADNGYAVSVQRSESRAVEVHLHFKRSAFPVCIRDVQVQDAVVQDV